LGDLMRRIATLALAGSLIVSSSAFAGEGALKPGLPAGVHRAQTDNLPVLAVGGIVAAFAIALIITGTSGGAAAPAAGGGSTVTSTSTTS
jgi:hypothetical protein